MKFKANSVCLLFSLKHLFKKDKNQPYHQRLREYRFYVNIGRDVNIGCYRCFYMIDVFT